MEHLKSIPLTRKSGKERFRLHGKALDFNLLDFWSWASSDLVGNALRGLIAEYLVARAVGADEECRLEWDAYDLITPKGLKIEVKSAGYIQSWAQKDYSPISFDISASMWWDARTNFYSSEKTRPSDVYVFCLLDHKDQQSINPLDVGQWRFYVLPTHVLDQKRPHQKNIRLRPLLALGAVETKCSDMNASIEGAIERANLDGSS